MNFRKVSFTLLLLTEAVLLPTSMAHAADWSDPGFPTDSGTSCIEGTTGVTGMSTIGTGVGGGDYWSWTGISGDENTFSLTIDYVDGGAPFDSDLYYRFSLAFLNPDAGCDRSFNHNFYDWPPFPPGYTPTLPPTPRFVASDICTPTVTGSDGSSVGTVQFADVADDRPEFQLLTLSLAPQTSAGTFTYTISFVCDESDDSGTGGSGTWNIDLSHFLATAESSLPNTL